MGSRAEGRAHALSDWDLSVETADFDRLARDLPRLLEPFAPLAQFWDPYSNHDAYMVILPGPVKLDICFFDRSREWSPAWEVRPHTLATIDRHFWDWILWTEQKRRGGYDHKVSRSLADMYKLMLRPMGVENAPHSVGDPVRDYVDARARLEREYGVSVGRALEDEVRPVVAGTG